MGGQKRHRLTASQTGIDNYPSAMATSRADELIASLGLQPHPEGGYFREVLRSDSRVLASDGRERSALTSIHFLLRDGEISRWHRVQSDELWVWLEGAPLALHLARETGASWEGETRVLHADARQVCVPAGVWQAARPLGDYTLVACAVAPGFEFTDFRLIAPGDAEAAALAEAVSEGKDFL